MKINPIYLDKFINTKYYYLYPVTKGVYLSFDKSTLDYIDVEFMFTPNYIVDKYVLEKLNELYSISYLI